MLILNLDYIVQIVKTNYILIQWWNKMKRTDQYILLIMTLILLFADFYYVAPVVQSTKNLWLFAITPSINIGIFWLILEKRAVRNFIERKIYWKLERRGLIVYEELYRPKKGKQENDD